MPVSDPPSDRPQMGLPDCTRGGRSSRDPAPAARGVLRDRAFRSIRTLVRLGLWALYGVTVDRAAAWRRPAPRDRRIALIRIDGIGDFIVWLGIAEALRERFPAPEFQIVLLAERSFAPLAERLPYFDEVWPVDYRRFVLRPAYRYRILQQVRRGGFSMAINPLHTRNGIAGRGGLLGGDALVRATGAATRIGSTGDARRPPLLNRLVSDKAYTRLIPVPPATESEFLRNAAYLRGLGPDELGPRPPRLPVSESDLPASCDGFDGDLLVLIPGALADFRRWPIDRFVEIARRASERFGLTAVACGGGSESHLGDALEKNQEVPIRNLVGRTSLPGLAALIARARLVVSNETGAAHLAAAVGTPAVCVLGGGHYGRFVPYPEAFRGRLPLPIPVVQPMDCFGCDWRCIYPVARGMPTPCIEGISVDSVWEAIVPLLASMEPRATAEARHGRAPANSGHYQ